MKKLKNGILIEELQLAKELEENAHGNVYLPGSIEMGVDAYNELVKEFPYYRLVPDGHIENPEHKVAPVCGIIENMYYDKQAGAAFIDLLLIKGSPIYDLLENLLESGGTISVSMEAVTSGIELPREAALERYPDIKELPEQFRNRRLFLIDKAKIYGVSIVDSPSFKGSYYVKESAPSIVNRIRNAVSEHLDHKCSNLIREKGSLCMRVTATKMDIELPLSYLRSLHPKEIKEMVQYLAWIDEELLLKVWNKIRGCFLYYSGPLMISQVITETLFSLKPEAAWINTITALLLNRFTIIKDKNGINIKWDKDLASAKDLIEEVLPINIGM